MSEINAVTCHKVMGNYHESLHTCRKRQQYGNIFEQHFGKTPTYNYTYGFESINPANQQPILNYISLLIDLLLYEWKREKKNLK